MKNPWEAVIFDLDGTLVDSLRDLAESTNAALVGSGLTPYPVDAYRRMVGNGLGKLVERAAGGSASKPLLDRILADSLQLYDRDCLRYTKPYVGMQETLMVLKADGIRLLVVTNKPDAQAQKIVSHLFGATMFEGVYGYCEGRKIKPDKTLTLQALASVHASPDRSLFIGDSDVDIETATHAGMKSGGAVWGFRGKDELVAAGADYLLYNPVEILNTY